MWNILLVNNVKCGHICACDSQPNIDHIIFDCILVKKPRRIMWAHVENAMPPTMNSAMESMTAYKKVLFLYRCLNGPPMQEWMLIYKVVIEFIVVLVKEWYKK
jgi:hypothetical protein